MAFSVIFIYLRVSVYMWVRGQPLGDHSVLFFHHLGSGIWDLGLELGFSGLAANASSHWTL